MPRETRSTLLLQMIASDKDAVEKAGRVAKIPIGLREDLERAGGRSPPRGYEYSAA